MPDAEVAASLNPAADELAAEIPQGGHFDRPNLSGSTMDRSIAVRAALKAGVLGVFIGIIPLLGIALTGALAVYFYRRESRFVLPAALGSRLGGAAGIVAFAISGLLFLIRIFVFHARQEYVDFLKQAAQGAGVSAADPAFQAVFHFLLSPSGVATTFFFGMIFAVALASAGGALASLFLRPHNTRM
jgi:hypothetical protein